MQAPFSKLLGTMAGSVVALVDSDLDKKVKSNFQHCMSVPGHAEQDEDLKAFIDAYVNVDPASTSLQMAGTVGVTFLAIIWTGSWRLALAVVVVLLLMVFSLLQYTKGINNKAETHALALLPARDAAPPMFQEDQQLVAQVLTKVLKVRDPTQFQNDAACVGIAQMIYGLVRFQLEYHKMSFFRDEDTKVLVGVGGKPLPRELQGLSTTDLGERMCSQIKEVGREFSKSFQLLHRVLTRDMASLENLLEVRHYSKRGSRNDLEALDVDKVRKRLNADDLEKATETLLANRQPLVTEAEIFLHNVYRSNKVQTEVHALLDDVMADDKSLHAKGAEVRELYQAQARARGEEAAWSKRQEAVAKGKAGMAETLQFYEQELRDVNAGLKAATDDEKNYTYWMFGSHAYVWENDVKLAKDKVGRFGSKKAELEQRIADVKSGKADRVKELDAEAASIAQQHTQKKGELEVLSDRIRSAKKEFQELEKRKQDKMKQVQDRLDAEGKMSVKHLVLARGALNTFAHIASAEADRSDIITENWARDLRCVKDFIDEITDAESLAEQRRCLWKVKKILGNGKIPLLAMVQQTCRAFTLTPGPETYQQYFNVHQGFEPSLSDLVSGDEMRQQALALENQEATLVN